MSHYLLGSDFFPGGPFKSFKRAAYYAVIYVLTSRVGQLLALNTQNFTSSIDIPGNITPIWITSGVFLALGLLKGPRVIPGVFVGAFFGNIWAYFNPETNSTLSWSLFSGLSSGLGDSLGLFFSLYFLKKFTHTNTPFKSGAQVLYFILFGIFLGPAISAFFGTTSLCLAGIVQWELYIKTLVIWLVGDACGVLYVTPALVLYLNEKEETPLIQRALTYPYFTFLGILASLYIMTDMTDLKFMGSLGLFLAVPIILLGVLRFKQKVLFIGLGTMTFMVILGVCFGIIPNGYKDLLEGFLGVQLILSSLCISFLFSSGLNEERLKVLESLRKLKDEADLEVKCKGNFMAFLGHEIRTPLSIILGYSELLKNEKVIEGPHKEYIKIIHDNGLHLQEVIQNLMDYSQLEAHALKIKKETFNFRSELKKIEKMFEHKVTQKKLKMDFKLSEDIPTLLYSDNTRIYQILINLISNAIKFSNKGRIIISVNVILKNEKKFIEVVVRDEGQGIGPKGKKQLFKPFRQLAFPTEKEDLGTGLGLAISKELAGLLGGELYLAQSTPGLGSSFNFCFPLEAPYDQPGEKKSVPFSWNGFKANQKILLVEDNETLANLFKSILVDINLVVDTAENGEKAIEMAAFKDYDLVIMDIQLPGIDGVTATKKLKSNGLKAPVLALTATIRGKNEFLEYKDLFDHYLAKPVTKNKLIEEIIPFLLGSKDGKRFEVFAKPKKF